MTTDNLPTKAKSRNTKSMTDGTRNLKDANGLRACLRKKEL